MRREGNFKRRRKPKKGEDNQKKGRNFFSKVWKLFFQQKENSKKGRKFRKVQKNWKEKEILKDEENLKKGKII